MSDFGKLLAPATAGSIRYADALLKGIKPEQAARLPVGKDGQLIKCNHPSWIYGHLAQAAADVAATLGVSDGQKSFPTAWDDLFKNGSECKDDSAGTIYPHVEELHKSFVTWQQHLVQRLPEISASQFAKPNPAGGSFAERFPTMAEASIVLLATHPQFHFGQLSTWRRAFGLGSAF